MRTPKTVAAAKNGYNRAIVRYRATYNVAAYTDRGIPSDVAERALSYAKAWLALAPADTAAAKAVETATAIVRESFGYVIGER